MQQTFPEIVKGTKGRFFDRLPEGSVKDWLWWQYIKGRWPALTQELKDLRVEGFWRDSGLLCVKAEGYVFYGDTTSIYDKRAYKYMPDKVKTKIPLTFFGVCTDIITRFKYPQAVPIAPPYLQHERLGFSWHHTETITDMNISPEEKLLLTQRFLISPGDVVFDIGAYIGYGSLGMAKMVEDGRVVAFECAPQVLRVLKRNIVNNKGNILVVPYAAWSKPTDVSLGLQPENQARSLVEGKGMQGDTKTTTIDKVVDNLELGRVNFISFSVNGAEIEALQGARKTLEKFKPNLSIAGWVIREGVPVWKQVVKLLEYYGYRFVVGKRGRVLAWRD